MKENWKEIKGFEGLYKISDLGNITSMSRFMNIGNNSGYRKEKEKSKKITNSGYYSVQLWKMNKPYDKLVHRLVAENFLNTESGTPHVNHKDGNKLNNNISNLEFCSVKENSNHAVENNLVAFGTRHGLSKINDKIAKEIYLLKGKVKQETIASMFNINQSTVSQIHRKVTWRRVTSELPNEEDQ